jgi:hypothetical protein
MEAKKLIQRRLRPFVLFVAMAGAGITGQACVAAAGAGAGAAGTAYITSRGAKAIVKGSPDRVQARSERVLSAEGIAVTEQKVDKGGARRELGGKKGDLDVDVSIKRRDDQTSEVEVTARKSAVSWDKDYAESLLNRIIAKG